MSAIPKSPAAKGYRKAPSGEPPSADVDGERGEKAARSALKVLRAACATLLYLVAGPSLIFLNKHIMVEVAAMTAQFYAARVAPIGLALAGTLVFGNMAYLHNSVAFVQILKAFAPVVLLCLLFCSRLERATPILVASIAVIVAGTVVAVQGELHCSPLGVAIMCSPASRTWFARPRTLCRFAEFFEAVKLLMMQILLVDRKFGAVEGLAVMGPAAVVALAAFSAASEDVGDAASKVAAHPLLFAAASLGGLVVNFATNMMLAATSALTLRITSLVRNISVVFVSRSSSATPRSRASRASASC
ncbi:hypothetical protein JL722_11686 [Aureococcus anophagefferens]|nr:hypothetical protein JL722_11686 [Aureococcus anophagefferens]